MKSSGRKLRALTLSTLLVVSVLGGVVAFSGTAAAANTAQLDFSSIYNADVVRGTSSLAGDFDNGGFELVSSSVAQNNGNPADNGVPDDGVFPAVTDLHPRFDFADFDSTDSNAWQATGTGSVTASVTNGQYETVHVVASAGGAGVGNPAKFELTLHYTDGSTDTSAEFTVPDWFGSPPSDPGYAVRDGMDRWGTSYENANEPALWGYAVSADSSKTLEEVTIDVTENQAGSFNFFGGAATTQTSSVVDPAPTESGTYDPPDHTPPVADAGPNRSVTVGELLTIDSSNSSDDEELGTRQWDVDDDGDYERTGETTSLTFDTPGTYAVRLRVWDDNSNSDTDVVNVVVSAPRTETPGTPVPTMTTAVPTTSVAGTTTATPGPESSTSGVGSVTTRRGSTVQSPTTPDEPPPSASPSAAATTPETDPSATDRRTTSTTQTVATGPGMGVVATLLSLLALGFGVALRRSDR